MMISKTNHGEFGNWAIIMYFQLIKWEKCQENMIKGTTKKDVCQSTIVLKVLF
jgi:hypothetical protein